jgi:hypothetical protein
MNTSEVSTLKTIRTEILPHVNNIHLCRYNKEVVFKMYISFETLQKIVDRYCDVKTKPVLKKVHNYEETNEYPVKCMIKNKKYILHLYKPYLESYKQVDYNILVKNMREIDKKCFDVVKEISNNNLYRKLDVLIDKQNILYAIRVKGDF